MVASLPARTTVLAAANPVEGSYNKGRTLQARGRGLAWAGGACGCTHPTIARLPPTAATALRLPACLPILRTRLLPPSLLAWLLCRRT